MAIMHSVYRESGTVTIDHETCKGCGQCAKICPADVLVLQNGVLFVKDSPLGCIACGHCMMVCPESSIAITGRGLSPDDIVTLPPPESRATPETLAALMTARRSVRHFSNQEVELELLEEIVRMASMAPMGIPPWDVGCTIISSRQQVQALAADIIKGYESFLRLFRPWVLNLMRPLIGRPKYEMFRYFLRPLAEMLVDKHRQGYDGLFWGAPALLIFHHSVYADTPDAVIPCTYAMLAAESLGLGTTMIGSAAPIMQRDKALLQRYQIPDGHRPALILIVGHPAVPFKRAIRRRFVNLSRVQ